MKLKEFLTVKTLLYLSFNFKNIKFNLQLFNPNKSPPLPKLTIHQFNWLQTSQFNSPHKRIPSRREQFKSRGRSFPRLTKFNWMTFPSIRNGLT